MKQLLILSGKGGTGKTTVASAFIEMSGAKAFADCDVDAPNLHMVIAKLPEPETEDYYGFGKAEID
jgi:MinD superfamily P-loop ATPase